MHRELIAYCFYGIRAAHLKVHFVRWVSCFNIGLQLMQIFLANSNLSNTILKHWNRSVRNLFTISRIDSVRKVCFWGKLGDAAIQSSERLTQSHRFKDYTARSLWRRNTWLRRSIVPCVLSITSCVFTWFEENWIKSNNSCTWIKRVQTLFYLDQIILMLNYYWRWQCFCMEIS